MLGKCGRVKNDEVVRYRHSVQVFECVLGIGFMACIAREIQFHIGIYKIHSLGATVYAMHQLCFSAHGIDTESASVTEHIQDILSLRVTLNQTAVITLIHKESCLLTFQPVDMELKTILHGNIVVARAIYESILLSKSCLERKGGLTLVIDGFKLISHYLAQGFGNVMTVLMHAHAMSLHYGILGVNVNDKAGKIVALAMHKTVGVVVQHTGHADAFAHVKSSL